LLAFTAASAIALTACTVHKTEVPALTGPSGLGNNITIAVSPDLLPQDGASQSLVTVTAIGSNGQALPNLSMRLAVMSNGGITTDPRDGSLSALNVVTNGAGQATSVFTAPPPTPCIAPCPDPEKTVQIAAIPSGTDFGNATTRTASIRLIPVGVIAPPPSLGVTASFTVSPSSPLDHQPVVFDGTSSKSTAGTIVLFQWTFGDDASTASGPNVTHTFTSGGDFTVSLTVGDNKGGTATTSQTVHVTAVTLTEPAIVVSPESPSSGQQVFFTSTTTIGSNGHRIVGYTWNFGDGSPTATGQSTSHTFAVEGVYNVLLTITDDQGHTATGPVKITVADTHAAFTFSPAAPTTTTPVSFDASSSKAAGGRTIVTYEWTFDGGATATGVTTSRTFGAGSHTVTLKVTDSAGFTSSVSQTVIVTP
jgi:PKD repeat protein